VAATVYGRALLELEQIQQAPEGNPDPLGPVVELAVELAQRGLARASPSDKPWKPYARS
jgi:hypothetical protein